MLGQDRYGDPMNRAGGELSGSGPVGLYVHVPFCERKCAYCDFYSLENRDGIAEYLAAVETEIAMYADATPRLRARTLYYGGGTPSILTIGQLERMQGAFSSSFSLEADAEITIEVNPGTVTKQSLAAYRSLGFNRLSIGVQSFDPVALEFLGRIHSADDARRCIGDARDAGFDNLSIDLIYSVPGQSDECWYATLDEAVALAPEHISAYSLIVEEQTPLFVQVSEGLVTPNADAQEASLYEGTMARLERAGFEHYEVSNYARPGYRSRHNGSYWDHTSYLGFGPSAHSFFAGVRGGMARRWSNVRSVGGWSAMLRKGERPLEREEVLTNQELFEEGVFLGLRSDGLDPAVVEARSGIGLTERQRSTLQGLMENGLATLDGGRTRLTPAGYVLCDEICARMLVP
jgi:oxygen-independent coproporphyrinogen III oxidase